MKITIDDGRGFAVESIPGFVKTALGVLNALPDGELLSSRGLCLRMNRQAATISHHGAHPAFGDYRFKMTDGKVYYGNPRTIKEAQKQFGNQ